MHRKQNLRFLELYLRLIQVVTAKTKNVRHFRRQVEGLGPKDDVTAHKIDSSLPGTDSHCISHNTIS